MGGRRRPLLLRDERRLPAAALPVILFLPFHPIPRFLARSPPRPLAPQCGRYSYNSLGLGAREGGSAWRGGAQHSRVRCASILVTRTLAHALHSP